MYEANLHNYNPSLFKIINDLALNSDFQGAWTKEQFKSFFMNKAEDKKQRPSMDELVHMFEVLDTGKSGAISG
jgi:Ca2+-binding EF-hand superfamily protein